MTSFVPNVSTTAGFALAAMDVVSEHLPVIVTVGLIVSSIAALRIFWTLWTPVDRRVNGDRLALTKAIHISDLRDKSVRIHLKSKTVIEGAILLGYCSTHTEAPYDFKQLLMARLPDGRTIYIRISEIEYLEDGNLT
ncbi:MAG: hypothetical protein J0L84_01635 [Verrucomicrobia bacterium]|nr:hypothetical protein [Verrucomicrobiota bacterium]